MKNYFETIKKISENLNTLQPLKREDEDRLWKKFRLEWNYNSNHIEGNTLTYGETELLLIFDKTTGEHELREYEEMKAHDVALQLIVDLANDKERDLSESFIRQLNKTILVRPFWKEAITPDGQPTRREIKIGEYKSFPNSVRLSNGEIFHYASPEETPAKMNDLMQWYFETSKTKTPVELAAEFHYKFVCIHPFDDGNGRIARLLMNYILLKNGLPPVIIKSVDKKNYLLALNKADVGDLKAFTEYIAKQLVWSLELSIKAAKGESIEEEDDIDKEIAVLKKNLFKEKNRVNKSKDVLSALFKNNFSRLFVAIYAKAKQFEDLFLLSKVEYLRNGKIIYHELDDIFSDSEIHEKFTNESGEDLIIPIRILSDDDIDIKQFKAKYEFNQFKKANATAFNISKSISITFSEYDYIIEIEQRGKHKIEKLYSENLSESEINNIANELCKIILEEIKQHVKK